MKKELELEIDSHILENAKAYAESTGTTVESLAEEFLKELVAKNR